MTQLIVTIAGKQGAGASIDFSDWGGYADMAAAQLLSFAQVGNVEAKQRGFQVLRRLSGRNTPFESEPVVDGGLAELKWLAELASCLPVNQLGGTAPAELFGREVRLADCRRLLKEGGNMEFLGSAYRYVLDREADPLGLAEYSAMLARGECRENILGDLMASDEAVNKLGVEGVSQLAAKLDLVGRGDA